MTIGEKLKILRDKKGVTQSDVASAIDVSVAIISNYEKDKKKPSRDTVVKLANYYGVDLNFLLGDAMLNDKDKKDIAKSLESIMNDLNNGGALAYGGNIKEGDVELYKIAINNVLEMIKVRNKEKYTPKKYK